MVYILLSSLLTFNLFAATTKKLPKFLSKQSIDSLRHISNDGKVIYYQSKLGVLNMTKNYKNEKVIELEKNTQFLIPKPIGENVLIEAEENFHSLMSPKKENKIFITQNGTLSTQEVAKGRLAKLEIDGNWISFLSPLDNSISFQNLLIKDRSFRIKLKNPKHPYFVPQFLMYTDELVYFTDIDEKGLVSLYSYSKSDKKYTTVYNSKFAGSIIEFCIRKNNIITLDRGLFNSKNGSQINLISLFQNKDYKKKELIYSSDLNDIGSLICKDENIYFIKTTNFDSDLNDKSSEIAKLNLTSKKVEVISNFKEANNLTTLGNRILTRFKQEYYIIEGKNDAQNDSLDSK